MNKILLSSAALLLILTGCGSGTSSSSTVTVERGPILGAVVVDSNMQEAVEVAKGQYTFAISPKYPVTAYGGYIDVNRNGVIDAGEVANTIVLKADDGEVLTILSTLLSSDDANVSRLLLDDLGLNAAMTPGEDVNVSALSDAMYQYMLKNGISDASDINASELNAYMEQIRLKVEAYNDKHNVSASELEATLLLELDIVKLDDGDADEANEKIKSQNAIEVITALPEHVMSPEQKEHVLAMISKHGKDDDVDESEEVVKNEESENAQEEDNTPENESESEDDDNDKIKNPVALENINKH